MGVTSTTAKKKSKPATAKLFQNGRSQAVRLPKEFRFEGKEVRIRRTKQGILLEAVVPGPVKTFDAQAWFRSMDELDAGEVIPGGRNQPPMQERNWSD